MARGLTREQIGVSEEMIATFGDIVFRMSHNYQERTGDPVRTIAATWALAPTAMRADAIATALFFEGGAELAFDWDVQWVRMTTDGRVEWSPGSTAELFV